MSNKYIKSIVINLFFIFVIFICGCGGTSSTKLLSQGSSQAYDEFSTGKIKGRIVASDTGVGLKGAIVEAYQCQAITDESGNYILEGIPAGDHTVTVRIQGYNASAQNEVRVFSGQVTDNINFSLKYATNEYTSDFQVLSINPYWGTDGDLVNILCAGCGRVPGRVTFNGADAQIVDWNSANDGRIKVYLPNNVETGPVKVILNNESSKELNDIIFMGRPVILGVHPNIASGGQTVVVNGRNFSRIYNYNKFQLNGQDCFTLEDDASINNLKVTLPANATTGELSVKIINPGEYAIDGIGSAIITIAPRLVYITPKRSLPGAPITLYGYNFGNNPSAFKVIVGSFELTQADILSLTDTSVTFKAPDNNVVAAGTSVDVAVQVNNAKSNTLRYTAYNNIGATISDYGIYDFSAVSSNNKLKLAQLKPTEVIAFVSTLSGNYSQDFSDDYYPYVVSAYLGGNTETVPTLPTSARASEHASRFYEENHFSERINNQIFKVYKPSSTIRASVDEPASESIEVYVRDFTKPSPFDAANDILQKGILAASTTHALVYLEESLDGFSADDCFKIAETFDKTYDSIATAFGVLDIPEGNIDSQPRIVLFLTDKVDAKPDKAAYFDSRDKQTMQVNTNSTEIIFASPNRYKSSSEEFHAELCHALHDMFYYNQRWDTPRAIYYGTDWQCAGLSLMARQQSGRGFANANTADVARVKDYLLNPEKTRLNVWPETVTPGTYGMQFLFAQYLFDRCDGWNTVKLLESGRSFSVKTGLQDIEMNILPSAKPSTSGLSEFFNDFCLAMYCDDIGFSETFPGYKPQRYDFKSISLRSNTVGGLKGKTLTENPVNKVVYQVPAFGCSTLVYSGGNWGDLEFEISIKPNQGVFKTWVIYYSTERTE
jgi:hypothetical protein